MWRDTAVEQPRTAPTVPTVKPVNEDEWAAILDRLETTRDVFRQYRELREVLSRREAETQALRNRTAELEEIMRKTAPMLLNMATTIGLAAKNEKPEPQS